MSSSKVKSISRGIVCSNVVKSGTGPYTYTCTTTAAHSLAVGDVLQYIGFSNVPQQLKNITTIAGTTGSTIVFQLTDNLNINTDATISVPYFNTGMTGAQYQFTLPINEGARGIVQSYVSGTGTAVYKLQGSLNGTVWSDIATVTHAAADGDVQSTGIVDPWPYFRINLTSVGAATKLYVLAAA